MGTLKVNGDIESNYGGSISIKMTNGSLNTSINTSGGWARGWYITLNGSSVGPLIGGHGSGSNNSMSRIYFGDYDNPWMKIEPTGTVTATKFNGSGENLTNLNGSNIASGTVPISRLPVASLNSKGIVQLVNSINNTSNVDAATPNSVKTAYDMAITARDQEIGGRNLLANYIASGGNTTKIDNMSIQLNSNGTDTYFYVQTTVDLNTTQTYTISCEAQNVPSGTVWQFPVGQQSNSNFILTINRNGRCYGTGTFNKAITAGQNIILDDIGGRVTSDPPIILSNFKLEKGYKATDWTPSVENIQAQIDSKLNLAGGTMTGTIITPGNDSVVIKPAKHNYDQIGASDCKFWKVFATTFYGNLSGNADTATTASAVAWANITDKPSSFTPSSHSHSYIEYVDTRANNQSPNDLQAGLTIHLKTNGTDGLSDGGNYHAVVGIKDWGDYSGGPYGQLAITENHMWFRNSSSGTAWNSWRKLLDSSNYTSYTVTKTGSGASGTWGINITGSAGSVAWGNVTGKPSSLAYQGSHNNLTASGNEFTFASGSFSGDMFINYRTATGQNGNITKYIFQNGAGSDTAIECSYMYGTAQSADYASSAGNVSWNNISNKPFGNRYFLGTAYHWASGIIINCGSAASWRMITIHLSGNGYGAGLPIDSWFNFYDYTAAGGTIINAGGINNGCYMGPMRVYIHGGTLWAWIAQSADYQTISVELICNNENNPSMGHSYFHESGYSHLVTIYPQTCVKENYGGTFPAATHTGEVFFKT